MPAPFSEEGIRCKLSQCKPRKAPVPDGIPARVIKTCVMEPSPILQQSSANPAGLLQLTASGKPKTIIPVPRISTHRNQDNKAAQQHHLHSPTTPVYPTSESYLKSSDNTAILAFLTENHSVLDYFTTVWKWTTAQMAYWCERNHVHLHVRKTKEIVIGTLPL